MVVFLMLSLFACKQPDEAVVDETGIPNETETETETGDTASTDTGTEPGTTEQDPVQAALDAAYRIDLKTVDVTFTLTDLQANRVNVAGEATLEFTMQPGQSNPIFHFDIGDTLNKIGSISLDGEALDKDTDLVSLVIEGANQESFEVQRTLDDSETHSLVISWETKEAGWYDGWFASVVDDTAGRGNEVRWPTINAPHELAKHHLTFRVEDDETYMVAGSGERSAHMDGDVQVFELTAPRTLASYTMMFVVLPAAQATVTEFEADGIPVRIVSLVGANADANLVVGMQSWMSEYQAELGPFPMPAMEVLLIPWVDGMEYYGATMSGPGSMRHELAHMWWGCSGVGRTWGDTWMDEALAVWIEKDGQIPSLPEDFSSDLGMSWGPIETGFDLRAYGRGAQVMAGIADGLGGVAAMEAFLTELHADRAFEPLTTEEFVAAVLVQAPALEDDLNRWLMTP